MEAGLEARLTEGCGVTHRSTGHLALLAEDNGGEIMVLELNEMEKETLKHALKVLDGELKD